MLSLQNINYFILFHSSHLDKSLKLFKPDLVVYNAGTDILKGDRLGLLSISSEVTINL